MHQTSIPPCLTKAGFLPAGIHEMTWSEFAARYGTNDERRKQLAAMETILQTLKRHSGDKVYVGGSFVTAKQFPADFDMTWRVSGARLGELAKTAPILVDRTLQKEMFGGELMATYPNSPGDGVLGQLMFNRRVGYAVGVVEINLDTLPG